MDFYSESKHLNLLQIIFVKLPKYSLAQIVQEQSRFTRAKYCFMIFSTIYAKELLSNLNFADSLFLEILPDF
ncbi:hypothetical protein BpHYR1_020938 [Brachionus plicatilis]|uniref:Uncharacterized protein n=1 Tax=Brachionus plicatilis TaxID=10195 RepID=A0A3M7RQM1_BRAPC|nr:hypothetical protein BpHYR1_020938 [Brachionus plicatilis]